MPCSTTTYEYDPANRLIAVNGQAYKWDNNGNLLNDGTSAYAYDTQNRLMTLTQGSHNYAFSYDGNGDRLTQSVDGAVTRYTLDLETGLTQVLSDESHVYLYGVDRLAQLNSSETDYFLGDALGSVRQLVDANAAVRLAENYDPYGNVMGSNGSGGSAFGFTGEATAATDLIYLRSRFYASVEGLFTSRDYWRGDVWQPLTLNTRAYVVENPINAADPSGQCKDSTGTENGQWPAGGLCPEPAPIAPNPVGVNPKLQSPYPSRGVTRFGPRQPGPATVTSTCYIPNGEHSAEPVPCYIAEPAHSDGYLMGAAVAVSLIPTIGPLPILQQHPPAGTCPRHPGDQVFNTTFEGQEIVYDFYHLQRADFKYSGNGFTTNVSISGFAYEGFTYGFSNVNGIEEYAGYSNNVDISAMTPLSWGRAGYTIGPSWGYPVDYWGHPVSGITSQTFNQSLGVGVGLSNLLGFDVSWTTAFYEMVDSKDYRELYGNDYTAVMAMQADLANSTWDAFGDLRKYGRTLVGLAMASQALEWWYEQP